MKYLARDASSSCRQAFTLVELLTSIAILMLLMMLFSQIIAMVGQTTGQNLRRADALSQARMALDRFGLDWDARIRRSDLTPSFSKGSGQAAGNDAVVFYSQVNGFGSGTLRTVSQVGYYITNSPYSLQRWDTGTTWNSTNPAHFLLSSPTINPPTFPSGNYQVLADDIFRLQFCFQLKSTGQLVATPPASFSDIGGVVVAVAVLDKISRLQVPTSQINSLVTILTDAPNGKTPEDQWTANLSSATLPSVIARNIRIYQRTFYSN